jgi:hypothetical protein
MKWPREVFHLLCKKWIPLGVMLSSADLATYLLHRATRPLHPKDDFTKARPFETHEALVVRTKAASR